LGVRRGERGPLRAVAAGTARAYVQRARAAGMQVLLHISTDDYRIKKARLPSVATYRRRATIVGIHNYGDVNRRRTSFTRSIIRQAHHYNAHTRFWLTETGGIVKFGRSFPCSTSRAAARLSWMFHVARLYRTSGLDRLYVYNWTGAGCDARFDAGLTSPDGTPRAGYRYLRNALPNYQR
jgi:hypothetical protein